MIQLQKLCEAD